MTHYLTKDAKIKLKLTNLYLPDIKNMVRIGFPGAAINLYQTIRGLIVNALVISFVGSVGLSAFAACNTLLGFFWSIPAGMAAVTRMLISVSVGEEDRKTTADITREMFQLYVPIMCVISALIIIFAQPLTMMYYRDASDPVYMMTVWGFRLLPLCMPLSIMVNHFVCYGQVSDRQILINIVSLFDGVISVSAFSALLIPFVGINGLYIANIINGVVSFSIFLIYSCLKNRHVPKSIEELMVMPDDFGVPRDDRIDISIGSMNEVTTVSEAVQKFCIEKGCDSRSSYFSGLALEEMAGNIVRHGFENDDKKHSIDVRVSYKPGTVILRLRDDCMAFDPLSRSKIDDGEDVTKNIGIHMIIRIAKNVQYQNMFGLNVLTITI